MGRKSSLDKLTEKMQRDFFGEEKRKPRPKIPKHIKELVWAKYFGMDKPMGKCYVCGKPIHFTDFEVGHNKAVAKGGSDNINNLRPICRGCNLAMGTMSIEAFKRKFFLETTREPTRKKSGKTKMRRLYRCKLPVSNRMLYCGKKRANKSCLRATLAGTKCPSLIISRK